MKEQPVYRARLGSEQHSARTLFRIDAQIGFDNIGWVAPGLRNKAARMVDEPAHIMIWGDGADGAVFVAAAITEAFFSSDAEPVIRQGIRAARH